MASPHQDNTPPQLPEIGNEVISYSNFSGERIPIYWGPNQEIGVDDVYNEPTGWIDNAPLQVPRAGRFILVSCDYCSVVSLRQNYTEVEVEDPQN